MQTSALGIGEGVVLGFDFGAVRIGVSVGNGLTRAARALEIIDSRTVRARWQGVGRLIEQWRPAACVVGLPRHPDGTPHEMTARALRFARQLEGRHAGVPVFMTDERYSSAVLGDEALKEDYIDDAAAAVILQQWFDEGGWPVGALALVEQPQPSGDGVRRVLVCGGREI